MFACSAVDEDFVDSAPIPLRTTIHVARPVSQVFAAFAHDPARWGDFFPGFDTTGHYLSAPPYGVGSRYVKRFLGIAVEETVLAWDEGTRFAFRVDRASAPVFHGWAEDYRFASDGADGTVVDVAIGAHPRLPTALARPVLPRGLPLVFRRVARNLNKGRGLPPA